MEMLQRNLATRLDWDACLKLLKRVKAEVSNTVDSAHHVKRGVIPIIGSHLVTEKLLIVYLLDVESMVSEVSLCHLLESRKPFTVILVTRFAFGSRCSVIRFTFTQTVSESLLVCLDIVINPSVLITLFDVIPRLNLEKIAKLIDVVESSLKRSSHASILLGKTCHLTLDVRTKLRNRLFDAQNIVLATSCSTVSTVVLKVGKNLPLIFQR